MGRPDQLSNAMRKTLLVISGILIAVGNCGGPLILRLYFIHGGNRLWLSTWLETVGFPIILIPLAVSYFIRRKTEPNTPFFLVKVPLFTYAAGLGLVFGIGNYLYATGVARLPVSTVSLIISTQLIFTAISAFFLVKQKFTSYTVNAIVLLTVGTAVLALHAGNDRPAAESNKMYILGFILTFLGAVIGGLTMPAIELAYQKAKQTINYTLVMEFQMLICLSATVFATFGMLANNDFKVIPREAREYELGEATYYVVLVLNAIIWQCFTLGAVGVIFCSSALLSSIIVTVLLPASEVLAVIFYHDKFEAEKGVALVLCLWGFVSHFYGEIKQTKKQNQNRIRMVESEMNTPNIAPSINPIIDP